MRILKSIAVLFLLLCLVPTVSAAAYYIIAEDDINRYGGYPPLPPMMLMIEEYLNYATKVEFAVSNYTYGTAVQLSGTFENGTVGSEVIYTPGNGVYESQETYTYINDLLWSDQKAVYHFILRYETRPIGVLMIIGGIMAGGLFILLPIAARRRWW